MNRFWRTADHSHAEFSGCLEEGEGKGMKRESMIFRHSMVGLKRHLMRVRWLICLVSCPAFFYLETDRFLMQLSNMIVPLHALNAWDLLFNLFNSSYVFIFIIPLFLFLVSDLLIDHDRKAEWMIRMGSRSGWWSVKLTILACSTLCYFALLMVCASLIASLYLPWDEGWSLAKVQHLFPLPFQPQIVAQLSPSIVLFQMSCLLACGLFTFGLIAQIASLYTRSGIASLLFSVGISFLGYVLLLFRIPFAESLLLFPRHFVYFLLEIDDLRSSWMQLGLSVGYWALVASSLWWWERQKMQKDDIGLGVSE